jgi:membrane protein DedA with SNARE-associated domain
VKRVAAAKALVVFALAFHLHHRFHGPPLDYLTLGAAAFGSWLGIPGPGEPILIAAGVLSARHKLDLGETLLVAFAGATLGGILGWLIALKAGRPLIQRRGPFLRARLRALKSGEEVFSRHPAVAVLMTTSWIAGINRVPVRTYMIWNAVGAALWTLVIGLGAYFAGPPIVEVVDDIGWVPLAGIIVLVGLAVAFESGRRRRARTASTN